MEMDEYQKRATKYAEYPGANEPGHIEGLKYVAIGLASEAGEFAGAIKRIMRDHKAEHITELPPKVVDDIKSELGDALWYISEAVRLIPANLSDVAEKNLEKLRSRAKRGKIQGSGDHR